MSLITRVQKQKATYWSPLKLNGVVQTNENGEPLYGPPEEIRCRWDSGQVEVITGDGTTKVANHTLITSKLLELGGFVILLQKKQVKHPSDPRLNVENGIASGEIITTSVTPNLRNTESLYEAYL